MSGLSKRQLREQLRRQTEAFISRGGKVQSVTQGQSGLPSSAAGRSSSELFAGAGRQSRTSVNDALEALAQRRQAAKTTQPKPRLQRRKKVVYDDFGEPLREVWVEE
jgi:hypothetical protein